MLAPGVGIAHQLELPSGQRMEWMDDSKPPRIVLIVCS